MSSWTQEDEGLRKALILRSRLRSDSSLPQHDSSQWPRWMVRRSEFSRGEFACWEGTYEAWWYVRNFHAPDRQQMLQDSRDADKDIVNVVRGSVQGRGRPFVLAPAALMIGGIGVAFRHLFGIGPTGRKARQPANEYQVCRAAGYLYDTSIHLWGFARQLKKDTGSPAFNYHVALSNLTDVQLMNPSTLLLQTTDKAENVRVSPMLAPELYVLLRFLAFSDRWPVIEIPSNYHVRAEQAVKSLP